LERKKTVLGLKEKVSSKEVRERDTGFEGGVFFTRERVKTKKQERGVLPNRHRRREGRYLKCEANATLGGVRAGHIKGEPS